MSIAFQFDKVPMETPRRSVCQATADPEHHGIRREYARVLRWPREVIRQLREATGPDRPARNHRATWVLPADLSSVGAGRRLIQAQLSAWDFHGDTDVAELLADELVTNALRHATGKPVLTLSIRGDALRCAVEDQTTERPHVQAADSSAESGRGMQMVDMLSRRWGVKPTHRGKEVWFEIPLN